MSDYNVLQFGLSIWVYQVIYCLYNDETSLYIPPRDIQISTSRNVNIELNCWQFVNIRHASEELCTIRSQWFIIIFYINNNHVNILPVQTGFPSWLVLLTWIGNDSLAIIYHFTVNYKDDIVLKLINNSYCPHQKFLDYNRMASLNVLLAIVLYSTSRCLFFFTILL